jgi:DNA mismatch endonuclease (patch repair protein)
MPTGTRKPQPLGLVETQAPSYRLLQPASSRASAAARGASKKTETTCEVALRRALWASGCRFRKNLRELPGRPDIVFTKAKLAIFCDGDFWHGRDWETRARKLSRGTNSSYWLAKIQSNMERDRLNTKKLEEAGWTVLRLWETQILADPLREAATVIQALTDLGSPSRLDRKRQYAHSAGTGEKSR